MRIKHRFEHFDPLTGEVPDPYIILFFEVVHRARILLKGRTSEQIKQAILIINKIYRSPNFVDPIYQELEQDRIKIKVNEEEIDAIHLSDDVEALYKNIENKSLDKYLASSNFQWYEFFAVITLSYVEKVCSELHSQKIHANLPPDHWCKEVMGEQISEYDVREDLIFANQAITYAETLRNQESTIKRHTSDQSRRAVNKSHQMSNELKEIVLTHYKKKYTHLKNVVAARNILEDLIKLNIVTHNKETNRIYIKGKDRHALQTDNPIHRFEIWIGKAKNTKS